MNDRRMTETLYSFNRYLLRSQLCAKAKELADEPDNDRLTSAMKEINVILTQKVTEGRRYST